MKNINFIDLIEKAFKKIQNDFSLTSKTFENRVEYISKDVNFTVYIENYFEVEIVFSFQYNHRLENIRLIDIVRYMKLQEEQVLVVANNQVADEVFARRLLEEISNIMIVVLNEKKHKKQFLYECFLYAESNRMLQLENLETISIVKKLNEAWHDKNYCSFLELYSKNEQKLLECKQIDLLREKASYIRKKLEKI